MIGKNAILQTPTSTPNTKTAVLKSSFCIPELKNPNILIKSVATITTSQITTYIFS